MRGSIVVLWRLVALALWRTAYGSSCLVGAKGVVVFPRAQYVSSDDSARTPSSNSGLRGAASSTQQINALGGGGHETQQGSGILTKQIARKKVEFDKTASSSMKKQVDESIPDCGTSRIDIAPVNVTGAGRFEWKNLDAFEGSSKGPCEIWIDSERVFEHQNCVKLFETVSWMKFDYSACRGACLLTFYWLLTDREGKGAEPMKHCVPIRNGDSSSKSGSGSQFTSATGSSSGSSSSSASSSSSSSSSGSGSDTSSCIFDFDDMQDLHTLTEFYDAIYGFGHRRPPAPKPVARHHEFPGPVASHWQRPHHHFGDIAYTATRTTTATEQCQYTATGGFICSSAETTTDSVQSMPGAGVAQPPAAEEHLNDLQNLHETHFQ
ncbi:hypothetical protein Gpo141_00011177 [Globisporangium polare]